MIRQDKQVIEKDILNLILNEADYCVIALSKNDCPYTVPMNFGYKNNNLYLHSSLKGKKIEILNMNNKVSFSVVIKTELVKNRIACNWGMDYMSIIGKGTVHFIENYDKKIEALDIIMSKYSKNKNNSFEYLETAINKIILIKIEITDLTGKISGYK
jgi:uncharacterized protein